MKFRLPAEIRHDLNGFRCLVDLNSNADDFFFEEIELEMGSVGWLDADMCAALGAVLYKLGANLNEIKLTNIKPSVEGILCRNGFLSHYGREKMPDRYGTTIPYQRFEVKDDRYFATYIENQFIGRSEMPAMSTALEKKFRESVFEIFSNAVIHSQTKMGIFSCGQFFPKKQQLVFTVADLGIGIRRNVEESRGLAMAPDEAISWATEGTNTTKNGSIPGGLGLKLLREFIKLNEGVLRIVSDAGHWMLSNGAVQTALFDNPFPGTVVNIEINTSDKHSYILKSEVSESDIF
ncbi:MAG TPA: ATP-binding protein [Terriglobia bacterium]|nr:ATP-binding protein [Terriglobia bacterium]